MKILNKLLFSTTFILLLAVIQSCNSIAPPQIDMHELGEENSKTVKRGTELHIDADIVADGKIQTVYVSIHLVSNPESGDWNFEKSYYKFEGLRNTTFHEDIDIDAGAKLGMYNFEMEVTDLEGNVTDYESKIEIIE